MKKKLEVLFNERFQGAQHFDDFLTCVSEAHVKKIVNRGVVTFKADPELRAYLLFLKSAVTKHLKISECSAFAYRKEFSTFDAVKIHAQGKFFFKTDLNDFFGSINSALVFDTLRSNLEMMPVADADNHIEHLSQLLLVNDQLPAGFPTSPSLSNACLYRLDTAMGALCQESGLKYSRYSDDIFVSGMDRDVVRGIPDIIVSVLNREFGERFSLNKVKSKFLHRRAKIEMLGLVILPNGKITVDKVVRQKLEVMLHFYSSNSEKFVEMNGLDVKAERKKIGGYLSHVRSVDMDYFKKIRSRYGTSLVDGMMN